MPDNGTAAAADPTIVPASGAAADLNPAPVRNDNAHAAKPAAPESSSKPAPVSVNADSVLEQILALPIGQHEALLAKLAEASGSSSSSLSPLDDDSDDLEEEDEGDVDVEESSASRGPVKFEDIDPGLRAAVATVHSNLIGTALKGVLDSDKSLAYNMSQLTAKGRAAVENIVKAEMVRIADSQGDRFGYDWNRAAAKALELVKPSLEALWDRTSTGRTGVGASPGGNFNAAPLTAPTRVPAFADDSDYRAYIADKIKYSMDAIARESATPV
jgi:hypothetical protein